MDAIKTPRWLFGRFGTALCIWAVVVCFLKFRDSGYWTPFIFHNFKELSLSALEKVVMILGFGAFGLGVFFSLINLNKPDPTGAIGRPYLWSAFLIAILAVTGLDGESWLDRKLSQSCVDRPDFASAVADEQKFLEKQNKPSDYEAAANSPGREWSRQECGKASLALHDLRWSGRLETVGGDQ
jgi:hypothetical protein